MSSRASAGFTMIEVLVIVAVLAVLAGVAVPVTSSVLSKARTQTTRSEMSDLSKAIRAHAEDRGYDPAQPKVGGFPPAQKASGPYKQVLGLDLEADIESVGWNPFLERGWNGPYMQGEASTVDADGDGTEESVRSYQIDAWDRYYVYDNQYKKARSGVPQRTVVLISGGPDRNPKTKDDNLTLTVYEGPAY